MIKQPYAMLFGLLLASGLLGGCAGNHAQEQAAASNQAEHTGDPRDPMESFNRTMWDFNWDVLDAYILRPVTIAYVTVMPDFARSGLMNAALNLEEPGNFFNNILQGKFGEGMDSLARFVLNSTVGLLGTIDVASKIGIERQEEEFGEVMGVWGAGTGPYLMIPAMGPSDARNLSGDIVDGMYYPMAILNTNFSIARFVVKGLENRAALISQEPQLEQSLDPYAFVKNAYFEHQEFKVTDGKSSEKAIDEDQLDDFADFESMLDDLDTEAPPADDKKDDKDN